MGDVGSVPLGYLIGWLLISVVVPSNSFGIELMTIVLLPAYYYADATITIIRRFYVKKIYFKPIGSTFISLRLIEAYRMVKFAELLFWRI